MREHTVTWTQDEELLHALAAGSTAVHRVVESAEQRPFASFLTTLAFRSALALLKDSPIRTDDALIGEVDFTLDGTWPATRTLCGSGRLNGPWDLGSMALLRVCQSFATADGTLGAVTLGVYLRGQGGFGGPTPPRSARQLLPTYEPTRIPVSLAPNASLLYRLLGDRNPLHANPATGHPILHGLLGIASVERALEDELGATLIGLNCRLNRPLVPDGTAELSIWPQPGSTPLRLSSLGVDAWTVASAKLLFLGGPTRSPAFASPP